MPVLMAVALVYIVAFLLLGGILLRRHRRRAAARNSDAGHGGRDFTEMLWTEARMCNPAVGGSVVTAARPQALPRGRRRH